MANTGGAEQALLRVAKTASQVYGPAVLDRRQSRNGAPGLGVRGEGRVVDITNGVYQVFILGRNSLGDGKGLG